MKQYKLVNNLVGWFAFVIAAFTYCMTIEPTASFWDCPEFITTGYKLEVGHPARCTLLYAYRQLIQPIYKRPQSSSQNGQYHERSDECGLYPIPFLEYNPSGEKTDMPR